MMRTIHTLLGRRRVLVAVALAMLAAAVGAVAYWTASGSGTASGNVNTLSAPTEVSGIVSSTTVAVSWQGAVAPGGGSVDGYYVQRFSGSTPSAACGSSPSQLLSGSASSCTDSGNPPGSGVPGGTYTYKVTAVWRSWTATSAASTNVTVASPTLTSTTPSSRGQGASKQVIALKGSNFVSGATASFGSGVTVESASFVSSTELKATISVEAAASTGARTVTVTNPNADVASLAGGFTVNAKPAVTSISPSSRGQGASKQVIVIKGSSFVSGATASFGSGVTVESTSFVSSTEVTATVSVEAGAATGARTVTITNPDAGVGSANAFTVNAKPTVSSASPSSRGQGAANQTIKITGSGFSSGASLAASFSGTGITVNSTSFVSSTEVTANITVESGAATGGRSITVTNGDAGVGTSGEIFTVNAAPTVESTSPSSRGQGASKQAIAIKGTNFVSGATANFGSGVTVESTSFVSSTELTATVSVESGATTGARIVTITNPDEGVGSLANAFTVNVKPTVTAISPASRGQGAASQTVKITGTGFVNGAPLASSFSGTGITVNSTSFVSSTEVTANITIESGAATGKRTITITNGDAGVGTSGEIFTVNAKPTVSSASPSSRGQGAAGQTIKITGTGFSSGTSLAASFSGTGITVNSTSFVSATEVTANITVEPGAATGKRTITITNGDAGVGTSGEIFTVNAKPTVTSATPSSRGQGAASQTIKITGTGFVNGASLAASFSGTGITVNSTSFVSSTEVTANITVESGAAATKRTITVTNGDAGVGTSGEIFTVTAGPTVASATPNNGNLGGAENVTIKGNNFVSGATSSFGTGITVNSTTFVSTTELTAKVTIEAGAATGARTVTVTNPDAGAGSLASAFTVNGSPTVTSTSPSSRGQGATNQTVKITGTNFESGAGLAATFSGTGITVNSTTFVSSTEVTANITIATGATTGAREVTVTNPDTTKASLASAFTVNAGPTITSPTEAAPAKTGHNGEVSVTITGSNFVATPTITLSNIEFSVVGEVKFNSATSLTVKIKESGGSSAKSDLTVTNPDGGSVTCVKCISA
jgi:urease gamma subunit